MRERILVVEDDPKRIQWFRDTARKYEANLDIALTAEVALKLLEDTEYTQIFLDHDLSDAHYAVYDGVTCDGRFDEETGFCVARWLADNPERSSEAEIFVHTLNEPAAKRMVRELHRGRRRYRRVTFAQLTERVA